MSEEQDIGTTEQAASGTPWHLLRETREARGLTILDVAQHLKLTPRQVEAMEAGDLAHLPGPAFARGFVRNYARYLHLDPALFHSLLDVPREVPPQAIGVMSLGQMPGPRGWRFSAWPALAITVALFLLALAGWHFGWFEPRDEQYLSDVMSQSGVPADASSPVSQPSPVAIQSAPAALPSAPVVDIVAASAIVIAPASSAPADTSSPAPVAASMPATKPAGASAQDASRPASAPAAAASSARVAPTASAPVAAPGVVKTAASAPAVAAAKGARRLSLTFEEDAWVEIRDASGTVVHSRLNPAGSQQEVSGTPPFEVVVGNAPHVKLSLDGKAVDLAPSTRSNVARLRLP